MNKLTFIGLISTIFLGISTQVDSFNNAGVFIQDSSIVLSLNQYDADSCVIDLLSKISKGDKADVKKYYSLSFFVKDKSASITIWPEQLSNLKYIDYKGFVVVQSAIFFCRGNISQSKVFKLRNNKVCFRGKIERKSRIGTIKFIRDPIIQGTYMGCTKIPIYIEIYLDEKINGFKIKEAMTHPEKVLKKG
jgi:hypothetical protein